MNDGNNINRADGGNSFFVIIFLIALMVSIGAVHYRVYVKHDIRFFSTEEDINTAQPWGSLYGN